MNWLKGKDTKVTYFERLQDKPITNTVYLVKDLLVSPAKPTGLMRYKLFLSFGYRLRIAKVCFGVTCRSRWQRLLRILNLS